MTGKSLYCLGIHFKCLYEQGINKKSIDIAEPCHICKYNKDCNVSYWSDMQTELKNETGILINHSIPL